ncbi:hypothetical protein Esti_004089 [Eimeria stiedai]
MPSSGSKDGEVDFDTIPCFQHEALHAAAALQAPNRGTRNRRPCGHNPHLLLQHETTTAAAAAAVAAAAASGERRQQQQLETPAAAATSATPFPLRAPGDRLDPSEGKGRRTSKAQHHRRGRVEAFRLLPPRPHQQGSCSQLPRHGPGIVCSSRSRLCLETAGSASSPRPVGPASFALRLCACASLSTKCCAQEPKGEEEGSRKVLVFRASLLCWSAGGEPRWGGPAGGPRNSLLPAAFPRN